MWTPSKVRYFYGKKRHQKAVHSYITERSLFLEDIEDSLEDAYATLAHHGTKLQEEKAYGYRCYDYTNHIKLNLLVQSLERYKKQKLLGLKPCLSEHNLQLTYEELKGLIKLSCTRDTKSSLSVDSSQKSKWIEKNPWCVAREQWEKLAYQVCDDLKIKVTTKEVACDLAYTITAEEVDCTLAYAVEAFRKDCSIDFDITEETWKKSGCKTPYEECKRLSDCGISFDIITGLNKCGIEIRYDYKDKCPSIEYEGKNIKFKDIDLLKGFNTKKWCALQFN